MCRIHQHSSAVPLWSTSRQQDPEDLLPVRPFTGHILQGHLMLLGLFSSRDCWVGRKGSQGYQGREGFSWKWCHYIVLVKNRIPIREVEKWTLGGRVAASRCRESMLRNFIVHQPFRRPFVKGIAYLHTGHIYSVKKPGPRATDRGTPSWPKEMYLLRHGFWGTFMEEIVRAPSLSQPPGRKSPVLYSGTADHRIARREARLPSRALQGLVRLLPRFCRPPAVLTHSAIG